LPQLSDFLRRFKFPGVPGAPGVAVPADRAMQLETELTPVFGHLEAAQQSASDILSEAEEQVSVIQAALQRDLAGSQSATDERVVQERKASAARRLQAATEEAAQLLFTGKEDARHLLERGSGRTMSLASRIAETVCGGSAGENERGGLEGRRS
jgi:hypothetical protein